MPCLCDSTHFVEVFEVKNKPTVRFTPARLCRVPDFGFEEVDCEVQFRDKN